MEAIGSAIQDVVANLGYPGLFLLIVLESTLVPVPSLLVFPFAGFLAHKGDFSLPVILVLNSLGAVTGSLLSYWIGAKGGKPILERYGKYFFVKPADVQKTEEFFAKRGALAIFIGRFVPVVRHVQSIPAGIGRMPLGSFTLLTFLGATIWGGGLMIFGYVVGAKWKEIAMQAKRVDMVIAALIVAGIGFVAIRFYLGRKKQAQQ